MMYVIVQNKDLQTMVEEVNALIYKGFKPQGGVNSYVDIDHYEIYTQAMLNENPTRIISEEFRIVEKGIVPGENGPEYHFTYQFKGEEHSHSLGKGLRNYTDEELKAIVLAL